LELTEQSLTAEDKSALQPVADRLGSLIANSTTNLVHDATFKPAPDSRIDKAMKAKLEDAYELARQRLVSAEDHLRTIFGVLTGPNPMPHFSLFTLVRGAAIPTVHARYLLDGTIDEQARLGRGLSARLENLKQQQKVHPEIQGTFFDERVEHLVKRAEGNRIAVIRSKNGVVLGFGGQWPTDTELFEKYVPDVGKTYFQYLSGYAHSLAWAQLPSHRAQPSDDPEISLVPTDVNVPVFAAVLSGALTLYDDTIGFYLGHGGYPPMVWAEAKKS